MRRGGRVLGLDQDPDAISACLATHSSHVRGQRLFLVRTNFSHLVEVARQMGWTSVDGILFDLGVSWHQISDPGRGFSFRQTGPLDMRMDPSLAVTAADLVNSLSVSQLSSILGQFGEVARPDSLARRIAASRPLTTTTQLAATVPATTRRQVFQALRLAVNSELEAIKTALPQASLLLVPGGRMAVTSFHSLEDRLVKKQYTDWQKRGLGKILTSKPVIPDAGEIAVNPKSQSAKLRVFQKL